MPDAFPTIDSSHWKAALARREDNPVQDALKVIADGQRWLFLYPPGARAGRYQLMAPDLLELRWSVWDREEGRTLAYGATASEAVDAALARLAARP